MARPFKYPWPKMEPCSSFVVSPCRSRKDWERVRQAGWQFCQKHAPHLRIAIQREGDGVRFWLLPLETRS
jgi:hypothetical protein